MSRPSEADDFHDATKTAHGLGAGSVLLKESDEYILVIYVCMICMLCMYVRMYVCMYVCMYWVEMDYDGNYSFYRYNIYIYTNGFMLIFRVYVNLRGGCIYIYVCVWGKL